MQKVRRDRQRREAHTRLVLEDDRDNVVADVALALELLRVARAVRQQRRHVKHDLVTAVIGEHRVLARLAVLRVEPAAELVPALERDLLADRAQERVKRRAPVNVGKHLFLLGLALAHVEHAKLEVARGLDLLDLDQALGQLGLDARLDVGQPLDEPWAHLGKDLRHRQRRAVGRERDRRLFDARLQPDHHSHLCVRRRHAQHPGRDLVHVLAHGRQHKAAQFGVLAQKHVVLAAGKILGVPRRVVLGVLQQRLQQQRVELGRVLGQRRRHVGRVEPPRVVGPVLQTEAACLLDDVRQRRFAAQRDGCLVLER
eukprot:Unigene3204_Nuclearia_a/m.9825 Unigene3204_Nuclearia_a/g.9825  ORF Unigene3204_Nuclearia_a/g.9825 Unigene3204_Nuclearia_a/m.9825 type:complete len:313 (+) Unigene3204_Nuclearia_a:1358-2296(+)